MGYASDRRGGGPPSELLMSLSSRSLENVPQGTAHMRAKTDARRCHSWSCWSLARSVPCSISNASTVQPHQASAKLTGARIPLQKSAARSSGGSKAADPAAGEVPHSSTGASPLVGGPGCLRWSVSQVAGRSAPGLLQRLADHLSCHFLLSLPWFLDLSLPVPLEPLFVSRSCSEAGCGPLQ